MKRPTQEQIDVAILWLRGNEGDSEESGACQAVATWLDVQSADAELRTMAREAGVPVGLLRKRMRASHSRGESAKPARATESNQP